MSYVKPQIRFYDKFDQLENVPDAYRDYFHKTDWDEIFSKRRVLVLAEPGYGKTRMLKEIVLQAPGIQKEAIFIDLKMVSGGIEKYIEGCAAECQTIEVLNSEEMVVECQAVKTANFGLRNSDDTIICFDALDEVQIGEQFAKLIVDMESFACKYDQCTIVISCRTHHYKRFRGIWAEKTCSFCRISDFQDEHVKAFLRQQRGIGPTDVERILEKVALADSKNILRTPRYLFMFAKLVGEKGVDEVLGLNRTDLFEAFIYGKLEREAHGGEGLLIDNQIVKRVLEKLALIMEMYQSNTLTKDELLTYFDSIESNLARAFLEVRSWETLRDRSLIKDNIDHVQFENREFQEYLAAKELARIAKNEQALYDLVVDAGLKEVIPCWFSTLGFLVELDASKVEHFLELGKRKIGSVEDSEYHKLLTGARSEQLERDVKREIFRYVWDYYFNNVVYIDYDIAEKLAFHYDPSMKAFLSSALEDKDKNLEDAYIRKANALKVIMYVLKHGRAGADRESFKRSLLRLIKDCEKQLQSDVLHALQQCNDLAAVESILEYYDWTYESNLEHLILILTQMKPNAEVALKYFIEGTKERVISSRYGLYCVTDEKLIESMIRRLATDEGFLKGFVYLESIFEEREHVLVENINRTISSSLLDAIEDFIVYVYRDYRHDAQNSQYVRGLLDILKNEKGDVIPSILIKAKRQEVKLQNSLLYDCFKVLLREEDVEEFIKEVEEMDGGREFAFCMLLNYGEESQMYRKATEFFPKEYEEYEERRKEYAKQHGQKETQQIDIYADFKNRLGSEEKGYRGDVFAFYLQHAERLGLTKEDIARLREIVFAVLNHNPLEGRVTITGKGASGATYTMPRHMSLFKECLKIAKKLGWDLGGVQQNILNSIPFAYYWDLELIFECINNVASLDMKPILEVYTTRQDDLAILRPESFMRACDKYNITVGVPILEAFVGNPNLLAQERRLALEVLSKLQAEPEKLREVFSKYINDSQVKEVAETANELLIELSDQEAIEWRLSEVKNRALKVPPQKSGKGRCLSGGESELYNKRFAKPLLEVRDHRHISHYMELLDYSN